MAEAMMMQQPKNEREETVQDPIELVELGLPVKAVVIQQQQPLKEERGETGQHPIEMVELVEAVVIQQQPKEERGKTGQDLQARGDTLAKAWTDLFSYLTDFQAELTLKENLVDVAEKEIQAQRKQLEELRPTQEVENAEILKLREGVVAKERQLLQMQSHINVKDQLLRSVQSELGNQMKLNDKLNKDLVQKNSEIVRMKGELERCNSKLALKEQDGVEDSSLSKLRKENAELKMHLTFVRKALELERRSLEMERKAHDLSKQSLMTMSLSKKRENELTNFLDVMDVDDDSEEDDMNNEDSMDTDYMPPHAPTGHDYVVRKDDVAQTPSPGRSRVSSRQRKRSVRLGPPSPQPATPRKGSVASAKRLKILKSSQTKPGTRGASQDSSKESADAAKSVHVVLTKASEPSESALVLPSSSDVYFPLTLTVSDGSVVIDNTEEHAHEDAIAAQYIASEGTSEETVPATSSNEGGKTPKKILKRTQDLRDSRALGSVRIPWTDADLVRAVQDVQNGTLSMRAAVRHYGVPKTTLTNRLDGKQTYDPAAAAALSRDDEVTIHNFIRETGIGRPVKKSEVLDFAAKLATERCGRVKTYQPSDFGNKWVHSVILRVKQSGPLRKRRFRKKTATNTSTE